VSKYRLGSAEELGAMWRSDHSQTLQSDTCNQPVGVVSCHSVGVVGDTAVGIGEVQRRIDQLGPLEPDPEQFHIHHPEVGHGQCEQVHRRADCPHLPVGQHHKVETVCDRSGYYDREEGHSDVGECPLKPNMI